MEDFVARIGFGFCMISFFNALCISTAWAWGFIPSIILLVVGLYFGED